MPEKIESVVVIEMMGRPAEHLKSTMKLFLEKLSSEKGVKIIEKKVHKPKKIKAKDNEGKLIEVPEGEDLFLTFAEVNLETESLIDLIRVVFAYMPSHVEILSPADFKMPNFDVAAILSEITKKMHQYDAIAKSVLLENKMLANKLMQMQQMVQGRGIGLQKKKSFKKKVKRR